MPTPRYELSPAGRGSPTKCDKNTVRGLSALCLRATVHHRKSIGEASVKIVINKEALNDTQRKTLNLLAENTQLSAAKIAEHIGISRRNVESNMKKLKDQGILIRHGSPKNGYWEIIS